MAMGIKSIGQNLWAIDAVYKVRGRQFRNREEFAGPERKAEMRRVELYNRAKEEALQWLKQADAPMQKFGDIITAFASAVGVTASQASVLQRVKTDCAGFPLSSLKTELLGGIDATQRPIKGYVNLLDQTNVKNCNGDELPKKLSGGAKNKIVMMLKRLCLWAYGEGILPEDPLRALARKSLWKVTPRNRTWKAHEITGVYNYFLVNHPEYVPLMLHCARNPGRISDMRLLTRENLFLLERKIRFISGKKKVPTTHIIHDDTYEYFCNLPPDCPWLFYRQVGEEYRPIGKFQRALDAAFVAANIPKGELRWHDLRHTAATWLADQPGIKTQHIMAIGGWKTRSMLEVYHNIEHDTTAGEALDMLIPKKQENQQGQDKLVTKIGDKTAFS